MDILRLIGYVIFSVLGALMCLGAAAIICTFREGCTLTAEWMAVYALIGALISAIGFRLFNPPPQGEGEDSELP